MRINSHLPLIQANLPLPLALLLLFALMVAPMGCDTNHPSQETSSSALKANTGFAAGTWEGQDDYGTIQLQLSYDNQGLIYGTGVRDDSWSNQWYKRLIVRGADFSPGQSNQRIWLDMIATPSPTDVHDYAVIPENEYARVLGSRQGQSLRLEMQTPDHPERTLLLTRVPE